MAKTKTNNGAIDALASSRRVLIDQGLQLQRERTAKQDRVAFLDGEIAAQAKQLKDVEEAITSMGGELEVWPPPEPAPEVEAEKPADA